MEKFDAVLRELDFTENEIRVYKKLIVLRESTASNLGKELKMSRRTVYDIVERLVGRGVVSFVDRDGKRYYKPAPLSKLLELLRDKEFRIKKAESNLKDVLENLKQYLSDQKINVMVLFGKEGVKAAYEDELEEGKPVRVICTYLDRTEELLKTYLPRFTRERVRRGIHIRMITVRKFAGILEKYALLEARYLPEKYISPASFTVYGETLSVFLWSDEPVVIIIKNKEIARNFITYFELLWKIADT